MFMLYIHTNGDFSTEMCLMNLYDFNKKFNFNFNFTQTLQYIYLYYYLLYFNYELL